MTNLITIDQIREIEFGLTSLCNAGCPLCARHITGTNQVKVPLNSTPVDIIQKVINELGPRTKHIEAKLGGTVGDNIMHPQALEIIILLTQHFEEVYVDTNGGVRSTEFWTALGKLPNLRIDFSLDGLEDTHNLYRINTSYQTVLNNAKTFIQAGGKARWKFIIFEHNQHQVDDAMQLAKLHGFERFDTVRSNRFNLPKGQHVDKNNYRAKINTALTDNAKEHGLTVKPSTTTEDNEKILHYSKDIIDIIQELPEVNCKTVRNGYLYIDDTSMLWPCCHLHANWISSDHRMKSYWENVYQEHGRDFQRLDLHTIEEILNHPWFKDQLPNGWTDREKVCPRCLVVCAKNKEFSITDRTKNKL